MRCSPTVHVDRLEAFHTRADDTPAPGPVSDPGQEARGEHEVELLLNRKAMRGVVHSLVRWRGHASADDERLRAEELAHCPEWPSTTVTLPRRAAQPARRRRARRTASAPAVPAA